jgi:hypothetical protein
MLSGIVYNIYPSVLAIPPKYARFSLFQSAIAAAESSLLHDVINIKKKHIERILN